MNIGDQCLLSNFENGNGEFFITKASDTFVFWEYLDERKFDDKEYEISVFSDSNHVYLISNIKAEQFDNDIKELLT